MTAALLKLGRAANGWLAPFNGYPFRLTPAGALMAEAVVPSRTAQVTATLYAETQALAHLALFRTPLLVGGADSLLAAQSDLDVAGGESTLAVSPPVYVSQADEQEGSGYLLANTDPAVTAVGAAYPLDGSWDGLEVQVGSSEWYAIDHVATATAISLVTPPNETMRGPVRVRIPPPRGYVVRLWIEEVAPLARALVLRQPAAGITAAGTVTATLGSNLIQGLGTAFSPSWVGYTLTIGAALFEVAEVLTATLLRTAQYAPAAAVGSAYSVTSRAAYEDTEPAGVLVTSLVVS